MAYKHDGFWRSMDTLKDRQVLEDMVEQGNMPWRLNNNGLTKKQNLKQASPISNAPSAVAVAPAKISSVFPFATRSVG
jgi:NDP-sugar pyrophosphorylase family protein